MIIERTAMDSELRPNMRGGSGEVTVIPMLGKTAMNHVRLLAEIVIPPCASIGEHEHIAETEYFIILEGSGRVSDSGKVSDVKKGDVVITGGGGTHLVENTGSVPLRMIAVIITDA